MWSGPQRRSRSEHRTELRETGVTIGLVLQRRLHARVLLRIRPHHSLVGDLFGVAIEKGDFDRLSICRDLFPGPVGEDNEPFSIGQNLLCLKGSEPVASVITILGVEKIRFNKMQSDSSVHR